MSRARRLDHRAGVLLLLFAGLAPAGGQAQVRPFPYALDNRDYAYIGAGLGLAFLGNRLVDRVDAPTFDEIAQLHPTDVNAFDRGATDNWSLAWQDRSDYLRNALLGSVVLVSISPPIFGHAWSDAVTLGVMSVEALSLAVGVTDVTKALAHRPRPYLYNQSRTVQERYDFLENKDGWGYLSFFSGHVASSFAAATFVSTVFGEVYGPSVWSKVVWGVTMSTAALVAYARVAGGVHFPTDVIMGAAVGSALGYLVPTLHRSTTDSALSLSVGPTAVGIRLTLR